MIEKISIPDNIEASLANNILKISGKSGQLSRNFFSSSVDLKIQNNEIIITSSKDKKKQKAIIGVWKSIIKNMIFGANNYFEYKLKIVCTHFPMKVKLEDNKLIVANYLGEKGIRTLELLNNIDIKIEKQNDKEYVIIKDIDKEIAGLYAAKIERLCRPNKKDRRVFQDGFYIIQKPKYS
ncbi:MAG: 50S ribosomal protein L6 [Candidatus Aenigmarchaeota archaeon ex4484_52]|nr:MAG: 50S ribosomal protein L6 [Candidatus Aenigmarchaeota archaeon ex4484_52]